MITIRGKVLTQNGDTGAITPDNHAFVYVSDKSGNALTSISGGAATYTDANGLFTLYPSIMPSSITVLRNGGAESKLTAQKFINVTDTWLNQITLLIRTTPKAGSAITTNTSAKNNNAIIAAFALAIGALAAAFIPKRKKNGR